jgi:hypothetical protein
VGLRNEDGTRGGGGSDGEVRFWSQIREHARCRHKGSKWMDDVRLALITTAETQHVVGHGPGRRRSFRIAQVQCRISLSRSLNGRDHHHIILGYSVLISSSPLPTL